MRPQRQRFAWILLLSLLALQAMGKRDSLLWVGIRNVGITFQSGSSDSAIVRARKLLVIAEQQDDALALSQLHSLVAFCLKEQGKEQAAMQEFAQAVAVGENHQFLQKATKARHDLYFTIMLPAYSLLTTYHHKKGQTANSIRYAREGIKWVASCNNVPLRVSAMSAFSEALMAHKDYMLVYEPMKQAVADALKQHQTDIALQMTAYLVQIESQVLHRAPIDIPWIKAGKELLPFAKTEHPKTLFLSAVSATDKEEPTANTTKETEKADPIPPQAIEESEARQDPIHTRIQYIQVRNQRIIVVVVGMALLLAIFFGYILWQRHLRRKRETEAERLMKEQYLEGMEQERGRLARELHDGVSNQLLAVEMKLNEDGLTEQTMQLLKESREEVRRFSHELMPPEFEDVTLDEIMEHYVSQFDGVHDMRVIYETVPEDADWSAIPHEKGYEIYRIVQEAMANALKHSGATMVKVDMAMGDNSLDVSIFDNGNTALSGSPDGIGLRTMRQRADSIGAVLKDICNMEGRTILLHINL